MASAKGVRHIHDRDPAKPREHCIKVAARTGKRCQRWPTQGTKLCIMHYRLAQQDPVLAARRPPAPHRGGLAKKIHDEARDLDAAQSAQSAEGGKARSRQPTSVTNMVLTEQARWALAKIGQPVGPADRIDPKQALLAAVRSAWHQRELWEQMLASTPEADWRVLGAPAIPGSPNASKGARIEIISKNLQEATKNAARISKLAIDAGIEERLVRLAEEQSALIADTVRAAVVAAIGSMNMSPQAEAAAINAALGAAATHLRFLAAGPGNDQGSIIDGIAVEMDKPLAEILAS